MTASWFMPKIIGHRGACGLAPENTLASISRAIDDGVQAVEFDVTMTGDGVPVVMHDFNVDRCSNGTGPVVLKSLDETRALDAGSWFDQRFIGEQIPTFQEALDLVISAGITANIEIKPTLGWEEPTARAVAQAVAEFWPKDRQVLISSMSPKALSVFYDKLPTMPLGLIVYAIPENWKQRLEMLHCVSLHCYHDFITEDKVNDIHASGARLLAYTVNSTDRATALFNLGVDGVFSDHPERLARLLAEGTQ